MDVWREHGLLLARHLEKDDLNWLRAAYASVEVLPGLLEAWPDPDQRREWAKGTLDTVEKGRAVCERHADL